MRSRGHLTRVVVAVSGGALTALITATAATAQVLPSPNATATENRAGFVWFMAVGGVVLGIVIALLVVTAYMRFAPRFQREEGPRPVRAERVRPGAQAPRRPVNITGTPVAVPAPVPAGAVAAAPARAAAPAAAPAAPAPAPAAAQAPAPAAPAQAPAAASPTPAAPTPTSAPAAAEHRDVALDQEVFEATLQELLAKGTDRRVAEGQARRAAMIAARKKAAEG